MRIQPLWLLWIFLLPMADVHGQAADQWPQWRGPSATGAADPAADPPVHWSENENVQWKIALPGLGHSTPVVWGDRIYVTTAQPVGPALPPKFSGAPGAHDNLPVTRRHRFDVLAIDRTNGSVVWQKTLHQALPHEGAHYTASLASSSPVTDGTRVFAFFGSYGLYCLAADGNVLWQRDLGQMQTKHGHGEGSSPVLHADKLVVNWDHEGQSFIAALDKRTGQDVWRVERDEVTSWSSPIVVEVDGKPQVIVSGTHRVRGYDLDTGAEIWECGGLSANVVATPVAGDGLVFVGSSYDTRAMFAIRLAAAAGDITGSDHVVWSRMNRTPYVPSPLLYQGSLYFLRHYQGILTKVNASDGVEDVGPIRLDGIRNVYASPVAAAGRIYVTSTEGTTAVISHGEIPRIIANNRLEDEFSASAAIVGNQILLRGKKYLYCLGEDG